MTEGTGSAESEALEIIEVCKLGLGEAGREVEGRGKLVDREIEEGEVTTGEDDIGFMMEGEDVIEDVGVEIMILELEEELEIEDGKENVSDADKGTDAGGDVDSVVSMDVVGYVDGEEVEDAGEEGDVNAEEVVVVGNDDVYVGKDIVENAIEDVGVDENNIVDDEGRSIDKEREDEINEGDDEADKMPDEVKERLVRRE